MDKAYEVFVLARKRINKLKNPYIIAHQEKMKNDMMYDDYIKWLDKNGHGVPIPKIKSPEDIQAEKI